MIRGLVTLAALGAIPAAILALAACIVQARTNARHRAVRRAMRAALLDQLIEAADFDLWANELLNGKHWDDADEPILAVRVLFEGVTP